MDNPYDHLQACFSALIKVEERTHNKYRTLGAKVRLTCKSEKNLMNKSAYLNICL